MTKTKGGGPVTQLPTGSSTCPICGKPATARHRPFCSKRCADIDLARWFNGVYRVETDEAPDESSPFER
jgi:endogenous inhibitor of DNA gyrase (YacG/DUF329 family)